MRKIKRDSKKLMFLEAAYIYCIRHELVYEDFVNNGFFDETLELEQGTEFDDIAKDLRCFRHFPKYKLIELTENEYEKCIDKFGEYDV